MQKIGVLIPDGNDDRALKVVRSLGLSGKARTFVLTSKNNIIRYSRFCTPFFIPNNAVNEDLNLIMEHILNRYRIDVILPVAEEGINYIHQNNWLNKYNIAPIPHGNVMNQVGDKWKLNYISKSLGIGYPKSILISKVSDINKISNITHYPVLIKPVKGAGGIGIVFAQNQELLYNHLRKQLLYNRNTQYIAQEFIAGRDKDISILCSHGKILAYTIQKPIFNEEHVFTFSKMIRFIKNSKILEYCQKLVSHIKWNGVAHLDFIEEKSRENLFLIDFNPRFWGTLLGSTFAGVNFPYLACLSAMGKNFPVPKYDHIEYYEVGKKHMLHLIFSKKKRRIALVRNSSQYLSLIDPMPTIVKIPAVFK
jgi:predicted ATP-grasp superfamily ATP-dependent carboligase